MFDKVLTTILAYFSENVNAFIMMRRIWAGVGTIWGKCLTFLMMCAIIEVQYAKLRGFCGTLKSPNLKKGAMIMRSKAEKLTRTEKAELRAKMQYMVDEANAMRDEASEKMYEIPKGYKLNTPWEWTKFLLVAIAEVTVCVAWFGALMWGVDGDDTLCVVVAIMCMAIFYIAGFWAVAEKNRPYRIEEHVKDFYINNLWYDELNAELNRLKAGIEDYNRQYAEQEEYIKKFRQYAYTISELLGQSGDLDIVTKAYDFHAVLKLEVFEEKLKLRLEFNEEDYNQMDTLTRQFRQKLTDFHEKRHEHDQASYA